MLLWFSSLLSFSCAQHGYDEDAENREPGHVPDRRIDDVFRITAAHKLQPGAAQIANTSAVLGGKVGPEKIFMGNSIDTASDSIDPGAHRRL